MSCLRQTDEVAAFARGQSIPVGDQGEAAACPAPPKTQARKQVRRGEFLAHIAWRVRLSVPPRSPAAVDISEAEPVFNWMYMSSVPIANNSAEAAPNQN